MGYLNDEPERAARMDALLRPRSIAVVGASAKRQSSGTMAVNNLLSAQFSGPIGVVHPTAAEISGLPVARSVVELGFVPDVTLVNLPAAAVLPVLEELEAVGGRAAVVPSAGFSSSDAEDLKEFMRRSELCVLGPNNMGYANLTDAIPLWTMSETIIDLKPGPVALVGQSGSACIFTARSTREGVFSKIISSGNEWQVAAADYVRWLVRDETTRGIGLVIESIPDASEFLSALAEARAAGKPVVVLRVGRTAAGGRATSAHTGAVVADDEYYTALFRDADIPRVDDYDELASVLECFAAQHLPPAAGRRIAALTMSGGQCAMVADLAEPCGVEIADFSPETELRLQKIFPDMRIDNPIDTGGSLTKGDAAYERAVDAVLDDPNVDGVILIADGQMTLSAAELEVEAPVGRTVRALPQPMTKPLLVASSSSVSIHPKFEEMIDRRAPTIRGIPNALRAFAAIGRNRQAVKLRRREAPRGAPEASKVEELRSVIEAARGATLPRDLALRILESYGVPTARSRKVTDAFQVPAAVEELHLPITVKVISPDIAHRSDVGGVITNLWTVADVERALVTVDANVRDARPDVAIEGFELQESISGDIEVLIGYVSNPELGALVATGSGGTLVELLNDAAISRCPITESEARELVGETRVGRVLAGYRGLSPETDLGPLAETLVAASLMAEQLGDLLPEMDINPVFVHPGSGQVRVVDVLFTRTQTSEPQLDQHVDSRLEAEYAG